MLTGTVLLSSISNQISSVPLGVFSGIVAIKEATGCPLKLEQRNPSGAAFQKHWQMFATGNCVPEAGREDHCQGFQEDT